MRRFALSAFVFLGLATFATAQSTDAPIPDRHIAISRDVDFPGGDLRSIFDTSFDACERACLNDAACAGFTFNQRSNSCFPKGAVGERSPYEGALSAVVVATPSQVMSIGVTRAADLSFLSDYDLANAKSFAANLSRKHYVNEWTAEALIDGARNARAAGNIENALRFTGSALTLADEASLWVDYADYALILNGDSRSRDYRDRALSAAINAYLRSGNDQIAATSAQVLARALETSGRGRDMIPALRLAYDLAPRDEIADALDDAIGKYGFRIVGTEVRSNNESPSICAEFSEGLIPAGVDYAPYVRVPDQGMTVTQQGNFLCVEGVQHGERYRLTFRQGLPSESGETTAKDVDITQYVRDRDPVVRFPGRAYVLPKTPDAALPIVTVNVSEVDLKLRRVSDRNLLRAIQDGYFGRPLSYWQEQGFNNGIAEDIWDGTGEVALTMNTEVTTRLPMGDVIGGLPAGIYALSASVPGADPYDEPAATQWFVISDLGLATMQGNDGLHVFVRSLASADVKKGVKVSLLSRANRVLGTAETDSQGYARFPAGLVAGTGGGSPAMITAEDGEADIAFLSLTDPAFDLSDRGVEGREPSPPVDVFVTTDRGAYRAGETIYATALTRDAKAEALADLPLTAILRRPDGVEYSRTLSQGGVSGGHVFAMPVNGSAPRGTWKLSLFTDPSARALASRDVLVEDFLPERIDFDLSLPDGPLSLSDSPRLGVEARYLFGAPAADMAIEGEVGLRAKTTLDAFPGYSFGRYDERFDPRYRSLQDTGRTNAAGQSALTVVFPDVTAPDKPLEATVTLRVIEGAGRPVERQISRAITPDGSMIGIKPLFDGVVAEGTEAGFDVIGLSRDLTPQDMTLSWTLNRVETRYQWYQLYGNWNWEPVTTRTKIASGTTQTVDGRVSLAAPVDWGRYEIVFEQTDGDFAAASTDFYAGWYAPADASATPDTLELSLDKPAYSSGEIATVRIVPRYAGKALITVMSDHLIDMVPVDLSAGENHVTLPVTDDWGAGAYVSATLIRPMDMAAGRNPSRAIGLSYAKVDPGLHQLTASFDVPDEATPRGPMEVALKVDGVGTGDTAYATIAAVDVGILNLTSFTSPDPSDHYFGQRKLGMGLRDVYGRLIDGMNGTMGQVRSGGDAGAANRMDAPPPTEELVAYFSGPLTVGPDGFVHTSFDLPSFNGTVRLMAVVWSDTGVGQAEKDVLVRDPVVVTASLPRFMAPDDTSRLLLEIVHAKGPAGRVGLDVVSTGITLDRASIPSGFDLSEGGKQVIAVPVTASETGVHDITLAITTPDGQALTKTLTLPVQVNDPPVSRTSRFTLSAGDSFAFGPDVFAGLMDGTGRATVAIGPIAQFDAPGLLHTLDTYPYGCTEQVTSKAMPLLYLDQVAQAMGLATRDGIAERVDQAIDRILTRQGPNGAFGLWRAGSGDLWLDAYASDFLSRARTAGYDVPDVAFRAAMDNLRNQVNYAPDFDYGGEELAYALMVLAREGAAAIGDLRYYADVKGGDFATPLATAQIGAALASYGDQSRADAMFARASAQMATRITQGEDPFYRVDYGTDRRDAAAILTLATEAGSGVVDRASFSRYIAGNARTPSTQEAMWTLMATNALLDSGAADGFTMDGAPVDGPMVRVLSDEADLAPVLIRNGSARDEQLTLTTFGVPDVPVPAGGKGFGITRRYYDMDGNDVDIASVAAGTRLVTVLEVTPFDRAEARLIVNDPLPAGLEIDNPNLIRAGDIRSLDWLEVLEETQNTEFHQDRFIAAVDWFSDAPFRLAYLVRATSPGSYRHPAALVEDMYRPDHRAWTDAGRIIVTE